MKFWIFVFMFVCISALLIISNNDLAMRDLGNVSKFLEIYFVWVGHVFSNFVSITGHVVDLDWLPK